MRVCVTVCVCDCVHVTMRDCVYDCDCVAGDVRADMDDDQTDAARKNGVSFLYFILAAVCACAIAFIYIFVPETKGIIILLSFIFKTYLLFFATR